LTVSNGYGMNALCASARNVRPSMSDDAKDRLLAALAALGHARLRDSAAEYRRAPIVKQRRRLTPLPTWKTLV